MCLVALAHNLHPHWRLVIAGNRDEAHARATAPLAAWPDAPVLAGRDLQAGGTWMGLGHTGRVAVVTNVRHGPPQPFNGPSRGALPARFLAGTASATDYAQALLPDVARYAPFNLIVADADGCSHVGNGPGMPAMPRVATRLADGVHGISNGPLDAPWPKTRRLCSALEQWACSGSRDLQPLWAALADERLAADSSLPDTGIPLPLERKLSAAFIRGRDYGTRASTLILIDHANRGTIIERRFGPMGVPAGETTLESSGGAGR